MGGGVIALSGIPADCPVATIQVRVQQTPATGLNGEIFGRSLPFNVEGIGGGTNSAPSMTNLQSFSLISTLLDSPVTPLIFIQPQSQTASPGANVSLMAQAASPTSLRYEWRFNG